LLHEKSVWAPKARLLPAAIEALVVAGADAEAQELAGRTEHELRDRDVPLLPAALACARGVLDGQTDVFLAAAAEHITKSAAYEPARAGDRALLGTVPRRATQHRVRRRRTRQDAA
jgi:hypothetical protein